MKKYMKVLAIVAAAFTLTSCPKVPSDPDDNPDDTNKTVDNSICNNSAVETTYTNLSTQSVFASSQATSAATAINACYGVDGSKYYYGASAFIYQKGALGNDNKYTYYLVTTNSGILHRFINNTTIQNGTLQESNVTVVTNGIYEITLENGQRYVPTYLGRFDTADIAVFSFKSSLDLPVVSLGSSDDLVIGTQVNAVGTPIYGIQLINSVSQGYVSGLNRRFSTTFTEGEYDLAISDHPAFQFDAPLNGGMEGGPVFDSNGLLVGITTYKYEEDVESLSMALPIDDVKPIIDTIITSTNHTFTKITLGIMVGDLESSPSDAIITPAGNVTIGVYISSVSNGNAKNAGMVADEVITGITLNAQFYEITNIASLTGILWRCKVGDSFTIQTKVANALETAILTKTYNLTIAG